MTQRDYRQQTMAKFCLGLLLPLILPSLLLNSANAAEISLSTFQDGTSLASTNTVECPENFSYSGVLNVCVANTLSREVVQEIQATGACQAGYEKIIGTQFCTHKNLFVTADRQFYLIAGQFNEFCPENYSRPPGSDICLEKQLSLIDMNSALVLIAPHGGTQVPPDETVGLFAAPPVECDPGFIKPPGFHFCIANDLAANAEPQQYEFDIPTGRCPAYWVRQKTDGFCLPINNLHICGKEIPCQDFAGDSFVISSKPLSCPDGYLKKQINIPSYDHFNPDDFTIIPVYACVPPDKSVDPK